MLRTGPAQKHRTRYAWSPAALGLAALLAGCASQPIVLQVYEGEAQPDGLEAVQAFANEHRHALAFPTTAPARSAVDATLVYSNDWPTASAARQLAAELEALGLTAVLRPTALENHVVFNRHIGVFFRPPGAEQAAGDDEARPAHFACVQDDGGAEALMLLYADSRLEVQTYRWTKDDTVIGEDHAGRWRKGRRGITLALDDGAAVEFAAETGCLPVQPPGGCKVRLRWAAGDAVPALKNCRATALTLDIKDPEWAR